MGGAVKALRAARQDELGGTVGILFDIIVPEAKDRPAPRFEKDGASIIILSGFGVLASVHLDRQLRLTAGQVDDEGVDNQLPGEPGPIVAEA